MYVRLVCLKALTKMHLLISQLGLNHLAVEASDVGNGLILRAHCLAGTSVGAVTEAELVHLGNHVLHTTGGLYATLGKQGELRNLAGYEEHGRTVLTSSYAKIGRASCRERVFGLV